MIQEFVDTFIPKQPSLFTEKHPSSYEEIVRTVVEAINPNKNYEGPNFEVIHRINDGSYQGTLVFVIPEVGYQPYTYWYVRVGYGSCSVCDTLEAIDRGYGEGRPDEQQAKDYQALALHIVQGLRKMGDEAV